MAGALPRSWIGDASLVVKVTGIVLLALQLSGWFTHGERLELVRRLERGGEPTTESPVARELLVAFGLGELLDNGDDPHRLFASVQPGADGEEQRTVFVEHANQETELVASFEEVGWWALEPDEGWAWLGLGLLVAATLVDFSLRRSLPGIPGRGGASDPPA